MPLTDDEKYEKFLVQVGTLVRPYIRNAAELLMVGSKHSDVLELLAMQSFYEGMAYSSNSFREELNQLKEKSPSWFTKLKCFLYRHQRVKILEPEKGIAGELRCLCGKITTPAIKWPRSGQDNKES